MQVRMAGPEDCDEWDAFVDREQGPFFFYFNWKDVYEAQNLIFIPLILTWDGAILGILPLVRERLPISPALFSLPEGAYGGCLMASSLSDGEVSRGMQALLGYAQVVAGEGCCTLFCKAPGILKSRAWAAYGAALEDAGFVHDPPDRHGLPCVHILAISRPFNPAVWREIFSRHQRKRIRKCLHDGVLVRKVDPKTHHAMFAAMYAATFRRHNRRASSDAEVAARLTAFPGKTHLYIASLADEPVSALLAYSTPTRFYLSKMPGFPRARECSANRLLFCTAIRDAAEAGYTAVEFGTTLRPGEERFKKDFSGRKISLYFTHKDLSPLRTAVRHALHRAKGAAAFVIRRSQQAGK